MWGYQHHVWHAVSRHNRWQKRDGPFSNLKHWSINTVSTFFESGDWPKNPLKNENYVFTEYLLGFKLPQAPSGKELSIFKTFFLKLFVYNQGRGERREGKKSSIWYQFSFQTHLYQKRLFLWNDTERGKKNCLNFVDPRVKSTVLTAGPEKQKQNPKHLLTTRKNSIIQYNTVCSRESGSQGNISSLHQVWWLSTCR